MASSSSKQQPTGPLHVQRSNEWAEKCRILMDENAEEDKHKADMVLERYLTLVEQQFEGILSNIPEGVLNMKVSEVDPKALKPIARILRARDESPDCSENREPNRPADLPPRPQASGPVVATPRDAKHEVKSEWNGGGGGLVYSMKKLFGGGGGNKTDPSPARALKPRVL
ncbi:(ABC) transporter [Perkinsus olseni]|uniref:(ABC) transporter n=1 Tax=Perkinsus olseni TaxID=32597 RepID=A0A7J6TSG2_PEROL|nr:(ABC) transporter [Perkinsus olseni]KAF4747360.1 (ABC) transporter [Perkinsus olseni]